MEINRIMILFSGCFLLVWSTYKWKIPHVIWDAKLTRVYAVILGLYNIILAICFEKDFSIICFVYSLYYGDSCARRTQMGSDGRYEFQ